MSAYKLLSSPLVCALLALLACHGQEAETTAELQPDAPVEITHPIRSDLTEFIDLNASTIFLQKETVRATFPGFIAAIAKSVGDPVRAGDLLLQLKTRESAAVEGLVPGALSLPASVSIHARTNGVLTALHFNGGDFVAEGEEIALIANPSSLRISLNVPYEYTARIDRRVPCELILPDGQKAPAVISRIIPSVDPAAQTQTFLLQLQRAASLPENLNLNARMPLRTVRNAIVIPRSAVLCDETMSHFWIMKMAAASRAVRVDITKGIESGDRVEVVAPVLLPSDSIVAAGGYGLPDTAHVTITGTSHE